MIEPLYSGVTTRSASASSIRRRSSATVLWRLDVLLIEVLVVVGDEAEPVVDLDLDAVRRELARCVRERGVVRLGPEAA